MMEPITEELLDGRLVKITEIVHTTSGLFDEYHPGRHIWRLDGHEITTDKIVHGYLPTYLRIAAALGPAARVCEMGVQGGDGLGMFQALFPAGLIAGVDCDASSQWPPGTVTIICAQDDEALPGRLAQHSAAWDLIADDASHDGKLTTETFRLLWPLIAPGGFYVIEDWMVGLGWPGYDTSMLAAVQGLLPLLTEDSDVEDITCRYGLAVLRKKAA